MFIYLYISSNLVTIFYYVIGTVYIYSWKKIDKSFTCFGDALCTFFLQFLHLICLHVVVQLYSEWPPCDIEYCMLKPIGVDV